MDIKQLAEAGRPLFVYGTLRDPDVLAAVLGRAPDPALVDAASAPGLRTVFCPGRTYPVLVADNKARALGLRLSGLTPADLTVLDFYEGEEYSRRAIEIIVNGAPAEADVYWPAIPVPADTPDWSLPQWTRRYKAAFLATETRGAAQLRARLAALDPL